MSRFGNPLVAVVIAGFVFGCSSDDSDDTGGIGGSSAAGSGNAGTGGSAVSSGGTGGMQMAAVTFSNDIHPILLAKCGGGMCHNGEQAPILPGHASADVQDAYQATQDTNFTGERVYTRILTRITDEEAMMPPDFANPPCMGEVGTPGCVTEAEVTLIEAWIAAGTPL